MSKKFFFFMLLIAVFVSSIIVSRTWCYDSVRCHQLLRSNMKRSRRLVVLLVVGGGCRRSASIVANIKKYIKLIWVLIVFDETMICKTQVCPTSERKVEVVSDLATARSAYTPQMVAADPPSSSARSSS